MAHTWTRTDRLPDGHRLFYTGDLSKVAIADESGATPENTDDGVLWLDFARPLMLGDDVTAIPVRSDARESRTPTDSTTIVLLAETFGWGVNVRGILYDVKRRSEAA